MALRFFLVGGVLCAAALSCGGHAPARTPAPAAAARADSAIGGPATLYTQLTGATSRSSAEIVVMLLGTGAVATLAAVAVFRASDRRAKDRGLFDQTTGS